MLFMVKTLENAVWAVKNFISNFGNSETSRDALGLEGYREFVNEVSNISNKKVSNKIKYNSFIGDAMDSFYEKNEKFESIDSKRDEAFYRISLVNPLVNQGEFYLNKLRELEKDYSIMAFNKKSEVLDVRDNVKLLKKNWIDLNMDYSVMEEKTLSPVDKVANFFYSIFNKDKVNLDVETFAEKNARMELARRIDSEYSVVENAQGVLRAKEDEFYGINEKIRFVKGEFSRVEDFLNNSEKIKNFYRSYIDNSQDELFRKHLEEERNGSYPFSFCVRREMNRRENLRKKSIDFDVVELFKNKFNVDLDSLSDNVEGKRSKDIPFEIVDRRNFSD